METQIHRMGYVIRNTIWFRMRLIFIFLLTLLVIFSNFSVISFSLLISFICISLPSHSYNSKMQCNFNFFPFKMHVFHVNFDKCSSIMLQVQKIQSCIFVGLGMDWIFKHAIPHPFEWIGFEI